MTHMIPLHLSAGRWDKAAAEARYDHVITMITLNPKGFREPPKRYRGTLTLAEQCAVDAGEAEVPDINEPSKRGRLKAKRERAHRARLRQSPLHLLTRRQAKTHRSGLALEVHPWQSRGELERRGVSCIQ